MAIDILLGFVKEGITEWASASVPSFRIRCKLGIKPSDIAISRYSGSQPSRQITTAQSKAGVYFRPFASTSFSVPIKNSLHSCNSDSLCLSRNAASGGAALSTPIVSSAFFAANTTPFMTWASILPIQPMRKLSTTVNLPG